MLEGWRSVSVGLASVHEKGHDVAIGELRCFWGICIDGIVAFDLADGVFQSVEPAACFVQASDTVAE